MNEHTHSTNWTGGMRIMVAAVLATAAGLAAADEFKGTLFSPWEAHGKVYDVHPKTLMFVGETKGILYAESGKGVLDAASMICPMLFEIDVDAGATRGEGRCAIYPKGEEGVIYATYSCQGEIGSCTGRLDLSGGTGKFEGASGSGAMVSRTGASELAIKLGPGGDIVHAQGLMTLREFSLKTR